MSAPLYREVASRQVATEAEQLVLLYSTAAFAGTRSVVMARGADEQPANRLSVSFARYAATKATPPDIETISAPTPTPLRTGPDVAGAIVCRVSASTVVFLFPATASAGNQPNGNPDNTLSPLWAMVVDDQQHYELHHVADIGPLVGVNPQTTGAVIRDVVGRGSTLTLIATYESMANRETTTLVELTIGADHVVRVGSSAQLDLRVHSAVLMPDGRAAFAGYSSDLNGKWGYISGLQVDVRRQVLYFSNPYALVGATEANTPIGADGFYDADFAPLNQPVPDLGEAGQVVGDAGEWFYLHGVNGGAQGVISTIPSIGGFAPMATLAEPSGGGFGFDLRNTVWVAPDRRGFFGSYDNRDGYPFVGYWGTVMAAPLRLAQRNDGLALSAHPRLRAGSGPSSQQLGAAPRVGQANTYS